MKAISMVGLAHLDRWDNIGWPINWSISSFVLILEHSCYCLLHFDPLATVKALEMPIKIGMYSSYESING